MKNTCATYQHVMTKIICKNLYKIVECYVDHQKPKDKPYLGLEDGVQYQVTKDESYQVLLRDV